MARAGLCLKVLAAKGEEGSVQADPVPPTANAVSSAKPKGVSHSNRKRASLRASWRQDPGEVKMTGSEGTPMLSSSLALTHLSNLLITQSV